MPIFVVGVNHKTAPIHLREKIYFSTEKLSLYLRDLLSQQIAEEAVLLSTCNRSELYCESSDVTAIKDWFCAQTTLEPKIVEEHVYIYQDARAISHMMQVACGLDSMILGEPQILGQMKDAYAESCSASAVGTSFHRLFQQIFEVAKEIRTTTAIGACPVSVASAAVYFARQAIEQFSDASVVIIGAGEASQLLARYLKSHLNKQISLINRTYEHALTIAELCPATIGNYDQLPEALLSADLVFSATGSALPIINKKMMTTIMQARGHRALMMIDIAVPRDIEADVAEIPGALLYCIDDLKDIIERNRQGREHAATKAIEMIQEKTFAYLNEVQSIDKVSYTIRAYRGQIEEICQNELMKAKQRLHQGMEPAMVLEAFATAYTQKLLHSPSVQLRRAGAEGRLDILQLAKQLFALPDPEIEAL